MTNPPIPTKNSKTKGQHTQTPPKTSITQRLRTDLGLSVGVTSNPTGVVKVTTHFHTTFSITPMHSFSQDFFLSRTGLQIQKETPNKI